MHLKNTNTYTFYELPSATYLKWRIMEVCCIFLYQLCFTQIHVQPGTQVKIDNNSFVHYSEAKKQEAREDSAIIYIVSDTKIVNLEQVYWKGKLHQDSDKIDGSAVRYAQQVEFQNSSYKRLEKNTAQKNDLESIEYLYNNASKKPGIAFSSIHIVAPCPLSKRI